MWAKISGKHGNIVISEFQKQNSSANFCREHATMYIKHWFMTNTFIHIFMQSIYTLLKLSAVELQW